MQDYYDYNFSVSIEDVKQVLIDTIKSGLKPLLYINGMYYDVIMGDNDNEK